MKIYYFFVFIMLLCLKANSQTVRMDTVNTNVDITSYVMTEGKIVMALLGNGKNKEYTSKLEGDNLLLIKPLVANPPVLNLLIKEENGNTHYIIVKYDAKMNVSKGFFDLRKNKPLPETNSIEQIEKKENKTKSDSLKTLEDIKFISGEKMYYKSLAMQKGKVIIGMTNVLSRNGHFYIRFDLYNNSSIPYIVEGQSLQYLDAAGRGEEKTALELIIISSNLPRNIAPKSKITFVIAVDQFGVTEAGKLDYYLKEQDGRRNFNLKFSAKTLIQ